MYANMGKTATDTITGFKGVVTAYAEYITGCNQVLLTPKCKNGASKEESCWFDEQRMKFGKEKAVVLDNSTSPGFGQPAPIK